MTLIKTSFLTAISTLIKIASSFLINKIVSVYIGPSGLAMIGQLQNFISIVTTLSNGAITSGVVKYTAEYQTIEKKQKIFSTSILICLISSFIISIVLLGFSSYFANNILKSTEYSNVFIIFGITIFLFALNTIFISILNGQKEIKKYILVNISGSIFSLLLTFVLVSMFDLLGALYTLVLNQSIVFFVTLAFIIKSKWFKFEYFKQGIDKDSLKKLAKYSLMSIIAVLSVQLSHMMVRDYIGSNLNWDNAGYWQGIWYISTMHLMMITTSLSIYYLPRLSEIKDNKELKKEIISGYIFIIPIVIISSLSIYYLKEFIIQIAFTETFLPMIELFKWQLIGDVIKIISWLLAYLLIAKSMTRLFIYTEVGFSISFVLFCMYFIDNFGLIGVTYAYSLNYFIYLLVMFYIFIKKFR